MFCPGCGCEYEPGVHRCGDCRVPLVEEPPAARRVEFVEFEEVLATYNPGDVAVLRAVLDSEGVTYFFKGESFANLRPLVDPARLMVRKDEVETARRILKDLKLAYTGISLRRGAQ